MPTKTTTGYAGQWHTDFGEMALEIDGGRVTGTYGPNAGRLEGLLTGTSIVGTWRQSAPCEGGMTWGTFSMTFGADGQSFACRWQYQDHLAPGWGNWYGRRVPITGLEGVKSVPAVKARPAIASRTLATKASPFEGKWDTDHGEMDLRIVGNRVTGTYGPNAGQLDGVISGNIIKGTWQQCAPCVLGLTWGTFTMTVTADRQSFTCQWHYADQYAPGCGNWYGSRASKA